MLNIPASDPLIGETMVERRTKAGVADGVLLIRNVTFILWLETQLF